MQTDFDGAGNLYNKYESENPLVKLIVKNFFSDFESIILPIKENIKSAFEIGCGEGYITEYVNRMGIPVPGADISPRIIKIARENHPHINFSVLSIYDLDFLHTQYDLIVANEVFEHLPDSDGALEKIKKIARKYILITVPNEPYFRIANILRLKYLSDAGNTPGHCNHWSKKEFEMLLTSHNLIIKKSKCSTLWTMILCEMPG